jgi:hypothetical protein
MVMHCMLVSCMVTVLINKLINFFCLAWFLSSARNVPTFFDTTTQAMYGHAMYGQKLIFKLILVGMVYASNNAVC